MTIKISFRILAGILAAFFILGGKGMRMRPATISDPSDVVVGWMFHLAGMLILFIVFFRWHRTKISPPADFEKHRIPLSCCWAMLGCFYLFVAVSLLALLGGLQGLASEVLSTYVYLASISAISGVVTLVCAKGLLSRARWAKNIVTIFSFAMSGYLSFPVALYTWWAVRFEAA